MAEAKTDLFSKNEQLLAELFKALGHPARVAILTFLAEKKQCYTGNISDELPLSRTTVNQHLAELKKAGLIKGEVAGKKTNYCLNQKNIQLLENQSADFYKQISTACSEGNCC